MCKINYSLAPPYKSIVSNSLGMLRDLAILIMPLAGLVYFLLFCYMFHTEQTAPHSIVVGEKFFFSQNELEHYAPTQVSVYLYISNYFQ